MEYENLIKEAKLVVEESEREYGKLVKSLEMERLAKDSLRVEMNMLEEKYENSMKSLKNDYEIKVYSILKCLLFVNLSSTKLILGKSGPRIPDLLS
jgi:hypothetical protein